MELVTTELGNITGTGSHLVPFENSANVNNLFNANLKLNS